jgi:hypothetical protein
MITLCGRATTWPTVDETSLRYAGWRVVLTCFLAALFLSGFGLSSKLLILLALAGTSATFRR